MDKLLLQKRFCSIQMCQNASGTTNETVQFFKPPMEKGLFERWKQAIGQHQSDANIICVCSLHFDQKSMIEVNGKLLLKHGTIPSIFTNHIHITHLKQEEEITVKSEPMLENENYVKDQSNQKTVELININQILNNGNENQVSPTEEVQTNCSGCTDRDFEIKRLQIEITHRNKLIKYWKQVALRYVRETEDSLPPMYPTDQKKQTEKSTENNVDPIETTTDSNKVDLRLESEIKMIEEKIIPPQLQDLILKPYKCGKCNESFKESHSLVLHIRVCACEDNPKKQKIVEKTKVRFECYVCKQEFRTLTTVQRHFENHANQKVFEDNRCSVCFKIVELGKIYEHLCTDEQYICCEYCSQMKFTSTKQLLRHLKSCHRDAKSFKCSKCCKNFRMESLKKIHQRYHNNLYTCQICLKTFRKRNNLIDHRKKHMVQEPEQRYLCEICGKELKLQNSYRTHMQLHKEATFKCEKCPQVFRSPVYLKRHVQNTHIKTPHTCPTCSVELSSIDKLKKHIRHVHNSPYVECEICSKKLKKSNLRSHKRKSHMIKQIFSCTYCPQTYKYKSDLNRHLKSHLGDKIHECNKCSERFQFYNDLQKHSYVHYKE